MTTLNQPTEKETVRIPVQMKLSALWASLMFLYIYADFLSLYRPGQMEEAMAGRMGPLPVTQVSVLAAAVLMLIPALMIFLSPARSPGRLAGRTSSWACSTRRSTSGILVGETWAFYILFGIVEIALTLLIVGYAWRWRNPRAD